MVIFYIAVAIIGIRINLATKAEWLNLLAPFAALFAFGAALALWQQHPLLAIGYGALMLWSLSRLSLFVVLVGLLGFGWFS